MTASSIAFGHKLTHLINYVISGTHIEKNPEFIGDRTGGENPCRKSDELVLKFGLNCFNLYSFANAFQRYLSVGPFGMPFTSYLTILTKTSGFSPVRTSWTPPSSGRSAMLHDKVVYLTNNFIIFHHASTTTTVVLVKVTPSHPPSSLQSGPLWEHHPRTPAYRSRLPLNGLVVGLPDVLTSDPVLG